MNPELKLKIQRLKSSGGEEKVIFVGAEQKGEVVMEGIMGPVIVPVKKSTEPEIVTQTVSKDTLRAHEVADLDPYGVRAKSIQSSAKELLGTDNSSIDLEKLILENEDRSWFFTASSKTMIAEVLAQKGYPIEIKQVAREERKEVIFKDKETEGIFWNLNDVQDLQLLESITDPGSFAKSVDFSKGNYWEFDSEITQARLRALFYTTKKKRLIRASKAFNIPLQDGVVEECDELIKECLNYDTLTRRVGGKTVQVKLKIPSRAEIKYWVKEIVMQNL